MTTGTKIEWADHTHNPWWGCVRRSPGCVNCYADATATRWGWNKLWRRGGPRRTLSEGYWKKPYEWDRAAAAEGVQRRVFSASMAELFELHPDLEVRAMQTRERARLFGLVEDTPHLIWMFLTKEPQNVAEMVPWTGQWPRNVWIGTSVEDQTRADERIPHLLALPGDPAVRFLSCEPLLGPLDLSVVRARNGTLPIAPLEVAYDQDTGAGKQQPINWVITGGESGHGARPMHPQWARSLRDQCTNSGVAFFLKQWGEWGPAPWRVDREPGETVADYKARSEAACATHAYAVWADQYGWKPFEPSHKPWSAERTTLDLTQQAPMRRWGKKAAGRELDGRTWHEFPTTALPTVAPGMGAPAGVAS